MSFLFIEYINKMPFYSLHNMYKMTFEHNFSYDDSFNLSNTYFLVICKIKYKLYLPEK